MSNSAIRILKTRELPGGGFPERTGGPFRPDASAWAAVLLSGHQQDRETVARIGRRLSECQQEDGRICLLPALAQTFWPTPLAILAWQGSDKYLTFQERSIGFLLATSGKHWKRSEGSATGHDVSLRGWPWIEGTHSWVEPTSLCVLALTAAGYAGHDRVREAQNMLMDRQLPSGGWNYGNTRVFNQELHSLPDTTGMALQALAGIVPADRVELSLNYLEASLETIRTPFSLGWAILGLSAWERRPRSAEKLISTCMEQGEPGTFSTSELSIATLALEAPKGLGGWLTNHS